MYAIDVSKWQGTMDWRTVKKAGISHAMLRAGYGNSVRQTDPMFRQNAAGCAAQGVHWGAYWYSYATSPAQARQEARCCLQTLQGLRPELPVAYDIEYEPGILALDNATRTAMVKAFLEEVEAAGYYGILYASTDLSATGSTGGNWPATMYGPPSMAVPVPARCPMASGSTAAKMP